MDESDDANAAASESTSESLQEQNQRLVLENHTLTERNTKLIEENALLNEECHRQKLLIEKLKSRVEKFEIKQCPRSRSPTGETCGPAAITYQKPKTYPPSPRRQRTSSGSLSTSSRSTALDSSGRWSCKDIKRSPLSPTAEQRSPGSVQPLQDSRSLGDSPKHSERSAQDSKSAFCRHVLRVGQRMYPSMDLEKFVQVLEDNDYMSCESLELLSDDVAAELKIPLALAALLRGAGLELREGSKRPQSTRGSRRPTPRCASSVRCSSPGRPSPAGSSFNSNFMPAPLISTQSVANHSTGPSPAGNAVPCRAGQGPSRQIVNNMGTPMSRASLKNFRSPPMVNKPSDTKHPVHVSVCG